MFPKKIHRNTEEFIVRIHDSHGAEAAPVRRRLRTRPPVKAVRIGKMPAAGGIGLTPGVRQPEKE
jgi:hypothetical protein